MWVKRWLATLEKDPAAVQRALKAVSEVPHGTAISFETAGHALAASELVAAGLGKPAPGLSPEAQRVAEALRPRVDELRADARAAVERLRQNPDPHDQWDIPDPASEAAEADSRDWRTQMDLLAMRLAD